MTASKEPRADQVTLGIVLILMSVAAMAFSDAVVKLISSDITLWQVFIVRSFFAAPCLLALAWFKGVRLRALSNKWVLLRSALLVLTWLAYYASLPVLELSVAAVAVYTNPILTALLSAALLGERVSGRQWIGVLIGFCGVAAILKPGAEDFSWFVLLPLMGAAFYSSAMVLTRSKCKDTQAVTLALGLHGAFIIAGLAAVALLFALNLDLQTRAAYPFLLNAWSPMEAQGWGLMILLGGLSAAFVLGVARAYQIAPPHIIGTFDYAYLISAALWGFIFFAERPDLFTVFGMFSITLAGVLVAVKPKNKRPAA